MTQIPVKYIDNQRFKWPLKGWWAYTVLVLGGLIVILLAYDIWAYWTFISYLLLGIK